MNRGACQSTRDVMIKVPDMDQALKFYTEVLGLILTDLETARQRLLEAGCRVVEEYPVVPRLYMRDPYGLTFNLAQR